MDKEHIFIGDLPSNLMVDYEFQTIFNVESEPIQTGYNTKRNKPKGIEHKKNIVKNKALNQIVDKLIDKVNRYNNKVAEDNYILLIGSVNITRDIGGLMDSEGRINKNDNENGDIPYRKFFAQAVGYKKRSS